MATKPRASTSQGQPPLRPTYEDFEPKTEFGENQEAHFLLIHLPGFTRNQIRISFTIYNRMLTISGERPIDGGDYRRLRFSQSYPVPQTCEIEKLQAKLNMGILVITMPKKLVSQQPPKVEAQTAQEKGPFPAKKEEPKPDKTAQEDVSPKRGEEPKPGKAHEQIPQRHVPSKIEEQMTEKTEEEIPQKFRIPRGKEEVLGQKIIESQKPAEEGGLKALIPSEPIPVPKPEKGLDEKPQMGPYVEQKPTLKIDPRKPIERKPERGLEEIEKRAKIDKKVEKEREIEKEAKEAEEKLPSEPRKSEKTFKEKEIRTRKEAPKTPEKEKETITSKEEIIGTIGKGVKQVSASASQVFTKISEGKWIDEDKPMLVNMGAALLVIAALGAYVSYRFAS